MKIPIWMNAAVWLMSKLVQEQNVGALSWACANVLHLDLVDPRVRDCIMAHGRVVA